ncbi:MAG TPA: hypothetical protein VD886_22765, partial [Herpetosiphonaceae bacterium]|nr:hypothetical protein [Herpetosiphonaceae bacterium]
IGDKANPITLPNSALTGNTNTASGLVNAVSYLNGARTVDKNGKRVKLVVVLVGDGLANVFNDGPATYVSNRWDAAPYYCGDSAADMDNPNVQYNCPSPAYYPGQTLSNPPLKAMIKAANDARDSKGIAFYSLVLGEQFGLTPPAMRLDEIAPGRSYMAGNPAQLAGMMNAITTDITEGTCWETSFTGSAAGAQVVIRNGGGAIVAQGRSDAEGLFQASLPFGSGPYTVEADHKAVIAPRDQLQIPRDYLATFSIPVIDAEHRFFEATLTNANPANAQCQ